MKRAAMIWIGIVLAGIAAAFVVSIFQSKNYVGGPILATVFAAAAWRTWYLAGRRAIAVPGEQDRARPWER
jgi:hypothetical protein